MFGTIVAGTDGSPTAGAAVARAADLARTCGAKLHLVSAYKPIDALNLPLEAMAANLPDLVDPKADALQILEEAAGKVRAEGIEPELHAVAGSAAEVIINVAESINADCVVVGSRGMTGAMRFLLGSVPNRVAHHAPCTVMIVRTT